MECSLLVDYSPSDDNALAPCFRLSRREGGVRGILISEEQGVIPDNDTIGNRPYSFFGKLNISIGKLKNQAFSPHPATSHSPIHDPASIFY
jgi:hypothetical protein